MLEQLVSRFIAWEIPCQLFHSIIHFSHLLMVKYFDRLLVSSRVLGFLIFLLLLCVACEPEETTSISGVVYGENDRPVSGATVRIKATEIDALTNSNGQFVLYNVPKGEPVFITAWASGYYIGGVENLKPGKKKVEITLIAYSTSDNPEYTFLSATCHENKDCNKNCSECHSSQESAIGFSLPIDEWLLDAHSQSATNPRFLSMYNGTDLSGNQSPSVQYRFKLDYGRFPVPYNPNLPYYGPGYKLDFPNTSGNCSTCHVPVAAIDNAYGINPNEVTGTSVEGVTCDFCHKISAVNLEETTGLPFVNRTGILSFDFIRPSGEHQFFAGPLDDVAPGEDTFSELQTTSQYCAACHYGVFWDTLVYNSFGEWLQSPYSDAETGKTCQDCHMPVTGADLFALPEKGGTRRDPQTIFSHRMPGAADVELLHNTILMTAAAEQVENQIHISVTLLNENAGHSVPTDSPLRQMLLLVSVRDDQGETLEQLEGPVLPGWAGIGESQDGYYAGLPGVGYAKILEELWTGITPTGSYWNPTRIVSDNRIPALGSDTSKYLFPVPDGSQVTVTVKLFFRRAFIELMQQKGWDVADILMEQENITLILDH